MYPKVEISNIVVRGVEVKKSEIRLKPENLHPWLIFSCAQVTENIDLTYLGVTLHTQETVAVADVFI